ncbi:MAG: GNAT family N-acetyltransferase [Candidatus Heimdallarchaeota archaeon]|nr:MAG: GNAT family N-acetyltransferase [Candidatus Heimdallarchaeota archaeon]
MLSKEEIIKYQKIFFNIWPPKHYFFLNGWILTFTGGNTGRSNSVLAVKYTGINLEKDIDFVESAYRKYNLPARFKLSSYFYPSELEEKLRNRGYMYSDYSINTMGLEIQELQTKLNEEIVYEVTEEQSSEFSEFLTTFSSNYTEDQNIMLEVTQRIKIPKKRFILAKKENSIVGSVMAILDPQGYLYIAELFIHPDHRRQKIGFSLLTEAIEWGRNHGATICWLHVEKENRKAIVLYEKLGFQYWYSYKYLMKQYGKNHNQKEEGEVSYLRKNHDI